MASFSDSCDTFSLLQLLLNNSVKRPFAPALDHEGNANGNNEDVILESFSCLLAAPVHEKAVLYVEHEGRHDHDTGNAEGRHPRQQPADQSKGAEELGNDYQERE